MAPTEVGTDSLEPPGVPGWWCCGDRTVQASLHRLGYFGGATDVGEH